MREKTISEIWENIKPTITIISAVIPLTIIISSFFIKYDKEILLKFSLAAIIYQIGVLIIFARDTQKAVSKKEPKVITKIQLNYEFWNIGTKFKRLDINALNGERFIEMIQEKQISVDHIRIIIPTEDAMKTYYQSDSVILDSYGASKTLNDSILNIESYMPEWISQGRLKSFSVRRLGTFPLDFYALLDGKHCLVGKYLKDGTRKHSVGLKSLSWTEKDIQLISHHSLHFEELWDSLIDDNI